MPQKAFSIYSLCHPFASANIVKIFRNPLYYILFLTLTAPSATTIRKNYFQAFLVILLGFAIFVNHMGRYKIAHKNTYRILIK